MADLCVDADQQMPLSESNQLLGPWPPFVFISADPFPPILILPGTRLQSTGGAGLTKEAEVMSWPPDYRHGREDDLPVMTLTPSTRTLPDSNVMFLNPNT